MHGILKLVCSAIWLVGIFALICMGLMPLGYDVYASEFMLSHPMLVQAIYYIAGIAGIIGLIKFTHHCMGGGSWCHARDEKGGCGCGMPNCNCCRK